MVSTFTTAHPAAAKARKTTRTVRLTDLVPHDRTVVSHLQQIDQAEFMIFCISPHSSKCGQKCRCERVFSIYDFLNTRVACQPSIQKLIRSLGAAAIERGYLIYQRYLELRKQNRNVTLFDAIKSLEVVTHRLVSRFTAKARRLMNRLSELSVKFRKACIYYGPERIMDGFVSTMPPWVSSMA